MHYDYGNFSEKLLIIIMSIIMKLLFLVYVCPLFSAHERNTAYRRARYNYNKLINIKIFVLKLIWV